jgi:hypothetical protein
MSEQDTHSHKTIHDEIEEEVGELGETRRRARRSTLWKGLFVAVIVGLCGWLIWPNADQGPIHPASAEAAR